MKAYLDSSALVKLYFNEPETAGVTAYVSALRTPIPYSHLHELEIRNGLRAKAFRHEATRRAVEASLLLLKQDREAGILKRVPLDWPAVFQEAERLSHNHTARIGCRSLDVLHVASALDMNSTEFVTFDERQAALAAKVGLELVAI